MDFEPFLLHCGDASKRVFTSGGYNTCCHGAPTELPGQATCSRRSKGLKGQRQTFSLVNEGFWREADLQCTVLPLACIGLGHQPEDYSPRAHQGRQRWRHISRQHKGALRHDTCKCSAQPHFLFLVEEHVKYIWQSSPHCCNCYVAGPHSQDGSSCMLHACQLCGLRKLHSELGVLC